MSLLTASWLPPFFFWEFCGFWGSCVCVFFVWLFGLWVWKSGAGAGAALFLLLSFPIHLSDSLTGYLCNWFCPRAFPFTFLIP